MTKLSNITFSAIENKIINYLTYDNPTDDQIINLLTSIDFSKKSEGLNYIATKIIRFCDSNKIFNSFFPAFIDLANKNKNSISIQQSINYCFLYLSQFNKTNQINLFINNIDPSFNLNIQEAFTLTCQFNRTETYNILINKLSDKINFNDKFPLLFSLQNGHSEIFLNLLSKTPKDTTTETLNHILNDQYPTRGIINSIFTLLDYPQFLTHDLEIMDKTLNTFFILSLKYNNIDIIKKFFITAEKNNITLDPNRDLTLLFKILFNNLCLNENNDILKFLIFEKDLNLQETIKAFKKLNYTNKNI